ncbi:MAG: hypothetical protein ACFCUS_13385 [Rubrimonas sp.]|uniref:hypothetical protein n=1 Tax=Rubrimonas sp. TaxID=2036015 RepID=UPI002FDD38D8
MYDHAVASATAEALRLQMARRDAEAAQRRAAQKALRERAVAEFAEEFARGHLTKRELAQIQARVLRAAEAGAYEALALRFPSAFCADGGRAINNAAPDWPDTLTGKARDVVELWRRWARPRGFGLKALIVDFPGGMPGDVGLFVTWAPEAA